jgi:hypothetical protein
MKKRIGTGLLGWAFACPLAAALAYVEAMRRNYTMFTAREMLLSGAFLLSLALLFGLLAGVAVGKIARIAEARHPGRGATVLRWLMAGCVVAVYMRLTAYSLLFTLVRQNMLPVPVAGAIALALAGLYWLIAGRFGAKGTNLALAVFLLVQSALWILGERALSAGGNEISRKAEANRPVYDAVRFRETPDIYCIVLESYQSRGWLEDFYGFDNSAFETALSERGFSVNPDAMANYYFTLQSLDSVFLMDHHYQLQEAGNLDGRGCRAMMSCATYNPALEILKANGYDIEYWLRMNYLYFPERAKKGGISRMLIERANPLQPLSTLVWPHEIDPNQIRSWSEYRERLLRDLPVEPGERPRFVLVKDGLIHQKTEGFPPPREEWKEFYKGLFEEPNAFVLALVDKIVSADPDAVILVFGDHGAYGLSYGWWDFAGDDPDALFAKNGMAAADIARDNLSILCAVRLGRSGEGLPSRSLVNLFRDLFVRLSGDESLAATRVADDGYSPRRNGRIWRLSKDGEPLSHFEPVEGRGPFPR